MMRNPEETIGNLIDKQGLAFIGSVDDEGFPNMKAMLPGDFTAISKARILRYEIHGCLFHYE
jgi:general stress protein 26